MQQQSTFARLIRSRRKRVVSALNLNSFIANHFAFLMKMGMRIKDEVDHFTQGGKRPGGETGSPLLGQCDSCPHSPFLIS